MSHRSASDSGCKSMRVHALVGTIVLLGCAMTAYSQAKQTPSQNGVEANVPGSSIVRLDPALDSVIAPDAKIERVATGFKFIEGPMWRQGRLWFSDLVGNKLYAVSPAGKLEMLKDHSGGLDSFPPGAYMGSNAMATDKDHSVLLIEQGARKIVRLDKDLKASLFLEKFEGKHLNSPNDLVYKSDGSLYFTDPPYGLRTQHDDDPEKKLKVNGVYRLGHALDHKVGAAPDHSELKLLVSDLTRPNGLAFSPDEKYLYVDNSEPKKIWMRYRVLPDGTLTDAKLLYDATADPRPGAPDGMKIDALGNIYSAGPGGVWIFTPEGKPIATILMPEKVANLAWAGPDRKMLYITASSSVYRVHLKIAGAPLIRGQ